MKRRWEPALSKKGRPQRRLRARNFVYDFVEDCNTIKKPDIDVILTDYVDGLGYKGDLIKMPPQKAYNNLLLTGMAVYDTPENREKYETEARLKEERQSPFIVRTKNVFNYKCVTVFMNKFNSWQIEPWHIRVSMRKAGLYVRDDSQIELPKTPITGPDMEKDGKEFYAMVTIANEEKARVRCRLHHFTLDPRKRDPYIPHSDEFWRPAELLFPDDETQQHPKDATSNSP